MSFTTADARDRVYGRITGRFHLACPACGHLMRGGLRSPLWRPKAAELQCGSCRRSWVIGLAVQPVRRGRRVRPARPMDQVPNRAELAQLALVFARPPQRAGGRIWRSNVAPACTCQWGDPPFEFQRVRADPECPRHGGQ